MSDKNEFRNIADIYVDSKDQIVVNWISGITVKQMRDYLKRASKAFEDMSVKVVEGELDSDGKLIVPMRGSDSPQ